MANSIAGVSDQSSFYSIIASYDQIYQQPITALKSKKSNLAMLGAILNDVKSKLTSLKSAASDIADIVNSPLDGRKATSSLEKVVTATAGTGAALSSHEIFVSQLARNHTMVSNRFTDDATTVVTALGAGDKTFTVAANGESKQVTVTIAEGDTDDEIVAAVASAINSAFSNVDHGERVAAVALSDTPTTSKLLLKSDASGSTGKMTLTDDSGGLLAALGIDNEAVASSDTTGGYVYADSELDAELTVDGISITRYGNTVDDVIEGVTLTLRASQEPGDAAASLTVGPDTDAMRAAVQSFITKYNDVISYLKAKTTVDRTTGVRSPLSSMTVYSSLIADLRITVASAVPGTGSTAFQMLYQIGITQNNDGSLSLKDEKAFNDAVQSADVGAVKAMFNGEDGLGNQIKEMLTPFLNAGGYVAADAANVTSRISAIDASIAMKQASVTLKEQRLVAQYMRLQEAMLIFNSQTSFLDSLYGTTN